MLLMLAVIFLSVALGLLAQRFGAREYLIVGLMAVVMMLLYLLFPLRFM